MTTDGESRPRTTFDLGAKSDALGLEPGVVRLVEYDDRWPALFEAERTRIFRHCGLLPLRVEHVGGTSIPGMRAKPVVDIAVGMPHTHAIQDYVVALERAGYEHRGERGVTGRQYFRRGEPRAFHLHLIEEGGRLWRDYLAFRNYLRANAEAARKFAELKRLLAVRFRHDREGYLQGKAPHIREVLRLADGDEPPA
jgi:GrpB-like predicted nucleotidyltransferase (UPF0157 family)